METYPEMTQILHEFLFTEFDLFAIITISLRRQNNAKGENANGT